MPRHMVIQSTQQPLTTSPDKNHLNEPIRIASKPVTIPVAGPSNQASIADPRPPPTHKRKRGTGVVTANACTECRRKRAKVCNSYVVCVHVCMCVCVCLCLGLCVCECVRKSERVKERREPSLRSPNSVESNCGRCMYLYTCI